MNGDLNFTEFFDRYLEGDLNYHEQLEFETRLKNDPVFARLFRLHKEVDLSLVEEDIMNFRHKLEKIQTGSPDLFAAGPMIPVMQAEPTFQAEPDPGYMEMDIINLREQLDKIQAVFMESEEDEPLPEYAGDELGRLNSEVDRAILEEDVMALRSKLGTIARRAKAPRKQQSRPKRKAVASVAAAVAGFLILTGSAYYMANGPTRDERLFRSNFEVYTPLSYTRGAVTDEYPIFDAGATKYLEGDYKGALEMMELTIKSGDSSDLIYLYAGLSALYSGDPYKAEAYLTELDGNTLFVEQSQWYTAGSYLYRNQTEKAMAILEKIAINPRHFYRGKAQDIIRRLKSGNR
jgi:hypothetical protein